MSDVRRDGLVFDKEEVDAAIARLHKRHHEDERQPPMRIVKKGWFGERELTHAECEALHLRKAAKLAGSPFQTQINQQARHLEEAARHRDAIWRTRFPAVSMPRGT